MVGCYAHSGLVNGLPHFERSAYGIGPSTWLYYSAGGGGGHSSHPAAWVLDSGEAAIPGSFLARWEGDASFDASVAYGLPLTTSTWTMTCGSEDRMNHAANVTLTCQSCPAAMAPVNATGDEAG